MLGHLSFGVADLARAIRFYDAALAPLGYVRVWNSADQVGYGLPGGNDRLALKLQPGPVVPPGARPGKVGTGFPSGRATNKKLFPGFHLALEAPSHAAVDRFHAEALRSGGSDAGAPGPRPHYGATYYAAFVHDPDGHKLEAVFQ